MASDLMSLFGASPGSSSRTVATTAGLSLSSSGTVHSEASGAFGTGAPSDPTLWEKEDGNVPWRTAEIVVVPSAPLSVDDILKQLRAQGLQVDKDSPVTVESAESSERNGAATNAKSGAFDDRSQNSPAVTRSAISLKDLTNLIRTVVAWEAIKRISIKVGQYMWPIVLRWQRRRQIRAMLAHRLPDP